MEATGDVAAAIEACVASFEEPMLSMYLEVSAERPDSAHALAVRARATLNELRVDPALARDVLARIEEEAPRGRTRALFAAPGRVELFDLDVELPVVDEAPGHVAARWGEPYLTPVLAAGEDLEPYGAIYVDRDHVRVLAVRGDAIRELRSAVRPASETEQGALERGKEVQPAYVASRSSAAVDDAEHRVRVLSRRFRDEALTELGAIVDEHALRGLFVLGPDHEVAALERSLAPRLAELVLERLPSLSRPDAPPSEVLDRLRDPIERARERRQHALLDAIRERGVAGARDTLLALQQGRLSDVAVSQRMDTSVRRGTSSGWVVADDADPMPEPGEEVEVVPLLDALAELSRKYDARLWVLRGEPAQRLLDDQQGVAGLSRW